MFISGDDYQMLAEQFGSSLPFEELSKALTKKGITPEITRTRSGRKATVVFTTHYETNDEDSFLAVCGSSKELGSWQPAHALEADLVGQDYWHASAQVPLNSTHEWKWIVVNEETGEIKWEERENRKTKVKRENVMEHARWDQDSQAGPLKRLPLQRQRSNLTESIHHGVQVVINIPLHITVHIYDGLRNMVAYMNPLQWRGNNTNPDPNAVGWKMTDYMNPLQWKMAQLMNPMHWISRGQDPNLMRASRSTGAMM